MSKRERLDKLLAHMGVGTRSQIKDWVRQGRIEVDGKPVKDPGLKVDGETATMTVDGRQIHFRRFIYIMLHKPAGVISATEDRRLRTVLDLLPREWLVFEPFPVGRLDRDTEGLLLLTNDGQLAHELLSPRKHVQKTYFAKVQGVVDVTDVEAFRAGVTLDDGYLTKPAILQVVHCDPAAGCAEVQLTITEGKFHQVKRMFAARGKQVTYLKRLSMGPLSLDELLPLGESRELTARELQLLKGVDRDV